MFNGFPEETIRFFLGLRFHNDASYFNEHRNEYEAFVKKPFFEFITEMAPVMNSIADDFELRPGKCLARIRRDTRFTKDKTPYRDHLWLMFKREGEPRDEAVMYWFELSPDTVGWGLGFWGPNRPALDALRTMIEQRPSEVQKALREARIPQDDFKIDGDVYLRRKVPEGVPEEMKSLYIHKELYISKRGALADAYTPDIARQCGQDYLRLKPMYLLFRRLADLGKATLDA